METILDTIVQNLPSGVGGVFLLLFLYILYQLRSDAKDHRVEYKEVVQQMFNVVDKNTESHTRLSESIRDLKQEIQRK